MLSAYVVSSFFAGLVFAGCARTPEPLENGIAALTANVKMALSLDESIAAFCAEFPPTLPPSLVSNVPPKIRGAFVVC